MERRAHSDPACTTGLSRRQFMQSVGAVMASVTMASHSIAAGKEGWLMKPVEVDPDSGAEIFQLTHGEQPTDDIYGEQPYGSRKGDRIAVRHFAQGKLPGGLSILDLTDGKLHPVLTGKVRFPAFHAWGAYLYYQQEVDGTLVLKRCHYETLAKEDVVELPQQEGRFSYGTVAPDLRYYAASVHPEKGGSKVMAVDIETGKHRTLAQRPEYHFKHEQFSMDGTNRVLIQANKLPDVKEVHLGALHVDREGIEWFPADRPHTPRPTGHEAWVGPTGRILFSTGVDKDSKGNIWTAGLKDASAELVSKTPTRFGHVSVSRCGRFWIGDATREEGIPIHIGRLGSGTHTRLVFSRTKQSRKQWTHTHPYLTSDNRWLIFNSTRSGRPQVHGARIKEGFLDSL